MSSFPVVGVSTLIWILAQAQPGERAHVQLNCSESAQATFVCESACGDPARCELREGMCRGCSGTGASPWIRFLKQVASAQLQTSDVGGDWSSPDRFRELDRASAKSALRFLGEGRWILADATTVWNFVTPWNDPKLRLGFSQLCQDGDPAPWVFFELDEWGSPLRPRGVVCSAWAN